MSSCTELQILTSRFDLRWPVIFDRFVGNAQSPPRTVEDLKDRYYSVSKVLINLRGGPEKAEHPYLRFSQHWLSLKSLLVVEFACSFENL